MTSSRTKRVLVIKDFPSNMIEEAILVLRGDMEIPCLEKRDEKTGKGKRNDYLIQEARDIINNYVKESKLSQSPSSRSHPGGGKPARSFWSAVLLNMAVTTGTLLLALVLYKLL